LNDKEGALNYTEKRKEEMGIESVKMLDEKMKKHEETIKSSSLDFSYFDMGSCKQL